MTLARCLSSCWVWPINYGVSGETRFRSLHYHRKLSSVLKQLCRLTAVKAQTQLLTASPDWMISMDRILFKHLSYRAALGSDWTPDPEKNYKSPLSLFVNWIYFGVPKNLRHSHLIRMSTSVRYCKEDSFQRRRIFLSFKVDPTMQNTTRTLWGGWNSGRSAKKTRDSGQRCGAQNVVQPQEHLDCIALFFCLGWHLTKANSLAMAE